MEDLRLTILTLYWRVSYTYDKNKLLSTVVKLEINFIKAIQTWTSTYYSIEKIFLTLYILFVSKPTSTHTANSTYKALRHRTHCQNINTYMKKWVLPYFIPSTGGGHTRKTIVIANHWLVSFLVGAYCTQSRNCHTGMTSSVKG